ncbi:MAG TPA: sortase [Phycisphaerae bacterium]|nr:sortase [Phycisphaerae bacterium]
MLNCDPGNGGYDNGATTGTITFRTIIQDQFTDTYPSGDPSVDHGDLLTDNVTVSGDLLTVTNTANTTGFSEADTSATSVRIAFGSLTKTVYAVNGDTGYDLADGIATGDDITFRFVYTLPTSDFETLVLTDYFPLPIFDISDPDANGSPGPSWALDDVVSASSPAPGHVKFGPTDTFRALAGNSVSCSGGAPVGSPPANADGTPCLSTSLANNSLIINYGNFDDPTNTDTQIDLLFTLTVTDKPFTDGLFLTNQAHADEGTTNSTPQILNHILDFKITAPYLVSDKSAVSSDNLAATLSAATPRPFNPPGTSGLPWTGGTISSSLLSTTPINSDISGVDAGDLVRFAIVVENQGSGLYGAFDVTVYDSLPAGYIIPTGGLHLKVTRGDGTDVSFTYLGGGGSGTEDDLFNNGIRLDDSGSVGSCEHYNPSNGRNIAIITYDLQVDNNVNPEQQIVNTGGVTSYSGKEGGSDYTGSGSLEDSATTTIGSPFLDKVLSSTELNNATNNNTQAVVGELATYTLTLTLPEGVIPGATLVDTLDSRMSFVDVLSVTLSSGVSASNTIDLTDPANPTHVTIAGSSANQLTFDFGTLTNLNDNTTPDTIVIVLRAVVLNVSTNQGGATLTNTSLFNWTVAGTGHQINQQTPTTAVTVIEPAVAVLKQVCDDAADPCAVVGSLDAGDPLFYRIQLTGDLTDSYDLTFSDPLPAAMASLPAPAIVSVSGANPADFQIAGGTVQTAGSANIDLAPGASIVIYVQGTVSYAVIPSQVITNTATARWTSLNGNVTGRSAHNLADSGERTGADGIGGALNDYAADNTATVNVLNVAPVKSIVSTSEGHTSESGDGSAGNPRDLAIGEVIRYRLSVQLPEGSSPAFILTDTLPAGFTYLGGANVIFLTTDHNTTEPLDLALADSGSLPPIFAVPPGRVSVAGQNVTFSLGDLVNNDNDADAEYVVIDFNALVNNDANNNNTDLDNNSFTVSINGSLAGTSNNIGTRIVEPIINFNGGTNNKTVSIAANPDAGDVATYTVTYTNTGLADAFEVRVLDNLPFTYLDLTAVNSPTYNAACQSPGVTDASNLITDVLDLTIDRVRVGCTVTFTYTATLRTAVTPNQTITNTASLTYTSLSGTGTQTPGGSGAPNGERNGTSGGVNDYNGSDTAQITTRTVARAKTLVDTEVNVAGNNNTQATIGEIVTYQLVITVPEGTTPGLQVVDTLGANMAVTDVCVSGYPAVAAPISASAALTTSLPGGFADACNDGTTLGTNNPLITASGNVITWSLGTVTNSDTNNANPETVTILYQAVVLNHINNQAGFTRTNAAVVSWTGNSRPAVGVGVGIVEATVTTTKNVSAGPYDAGNVVTYTIALANPAGSTTAFDTTLNDPLSLSISAASIIAVSGGGFTPSDFNVTGCPGTCVLQTAAAAGIDISANTTVTITLDATLSATVPAGQIVGNTAATRWTSMNGVVGDRSTYNINSEERDGSDGLPGPGILNDYRSQGTVSLTVATPTIAKQAPTPTRYAIGATVTYPILVTLPEGVTRSLRVIDQVPAGMVYAGSSVDDSSFAGTVNTSPAISPASPADGDDVTFTFGDTTTTDDNNGANNSFILNVTLRVLNVSANQIGTTLTNGAVLRYVNPNTGTDAPDVPGGTQAITVAEPRIVTDKQVSPAANVQAGTLLTYTISFTNTNNPITNVSTAYEVSATDLLAQGVTFTSLTSCNLDTPATDLTGVTTVDTSTPGQVTFSGSAWDVPAGSAITCIYTATAQSGLYVDGSHANTVDADWTSIDGPDANERNYDDSVVRTVDGTQDTATASFNVGGLSLDKTVDVTQVVIGQDVHYTLTLSGPTGTIRSAVVTDHLPAGLIYNNDSAISGLASSPSPAVSGPADGSGPVTLTWTFGDVYKNAANATISYSVRAANVATNVEGQTLPNTVWFDHHYADGTPAPRLTDSTTVTVREPLLTVDKIIAYIDVTQDAGDTVIYRTTIAPAASSLVTAYDVHFTDTLPAAVLLDIPSITVTGGTVASDSSSGNTIDLTIDSIAVGGSVVIEYSGTIAGSVTPGQLVTNTSDATWCSLHDTNGDSGTVSGERDGSDGSGGLNDYAGSDNVSFTVGSYTFNKSIVSPASGKLAVGQLVTYDLAVVLSEGSSPAPIAIIDDLPLGLEYVSSSMQLVTAGFNGTINPSDPVVSCAASCGSGDDVTFTFNNSISVAADNDSSNNTFHVRFQARLLNINVNQNNAPLDNQASLQIGAGTPVDSNIVTVTVIEPELQVQKSVDNPAPRYLEQITFTLTLSHLPSSTADAHEVTVTDTLPAGLQYVAGSITAPGGWTPNDSTPSSLAWTGDLSLATGSVQFTFKATIADPPASPGDTLANNVNAAWSSLPGDVSSGQPEGERDGSGGVNDYADSASRDITYTNVDYTLTKSDGGITAVAGGNVIYTLSYNNAGNLDATGVILTETVPDHATYDSADNSTAWDCGPVNPAASGTTCAFSVGTVAAGTVGSVTFVIRVDNPLPAGVDTLTNTASIDDDHAHGPNPSPKTASDTTPVTAAPALEVTKDDGWEIVAPGAEVDYTITVTNNGDQDATGVQLVDTLPSGMTFVTAPGCTTCGSSQVTWPAFDLAVGASRQFTVNIRVNDAADLLSAGITFITNTVDVQDDGNNTNGTPVTAQATDTDQIAISSAKLLTGTEQPGSHNLDVLIGEVLDYSITMNVPSGTIDHLQAVDVLDSGLAFVDVTTIQVSNPDADGAGTTDDGIYSNVMTFDSSGICTNCTAGTTSGSNPLVENEGGKLTFNFGRLTNDDPTQKITVEYRVIVLNLAANVNGTSGLNNLVTWSWEGGTLSGEAAAVDVIEPKLTIEKTVTPEIAALESTVTYNLEIGHDLSSTAPAYDVLVTDAIPTGLVLDEASVQVVGSLGLPTPTITTGPTQLSVYWSEFPLASTATITFQAQFIGPSPVVNTANVEWSSIQIDPRQHLLPFSDYNVHSTERRYDPVIGGGVNNYRTSASVTLRQPVLPQTGFAPGELTVLPQQPSDSRYLAMGDLWLEIPALGVRVPIIGVPSGSNGWDLTWLWDQAGYLEGTAYPTWTGNSVLTAHVYLSDGSPGPFVNLKTLYWGQQVIVHLGRQKYIYQVQDVRRVWPDDNTVLAHQADPTLTLITCQDYDPVRQTYRYRIAVRAVLVKTEADANASSRPAGGY